MKSFQANHHVPVIRRAALRAVWLRAQGGLED
jgi:hypothetical protein